MNEGNPDRLAFLLRTVERMAQHLQITSRRLFARKIDAEWLKSLDENPDASEQLDAFVARFGRLQDTIAGKLIPELLRLSLETPGSVLDNLNRMEKLGLIHSVDEWMEARNLRNRLIHEYMHDPEAFLQALERAEQLVPALLASYESIENYLKERWGERLT